MLRWNYYDSSHRRRCRLIRRCERISLRPMSTDRRSLARSFIKVNYIEWDINGIQLRIRQPFVAMRITSATAYEKHNHCARVLGDVCAAGIRLSFHQNEKKRSKKTNRYKHVRRGHANQRRCRFFFVWIHIFFRRDSFSTLWMAWVRVSLKFRVRTASEKFIDHFRWQIHRNFMLASNKMREFLNFLLFHRSLPEAESPFVFMHLKRQCDAPCGPWSSVFIQIRESKIIPLRVNCCARFHAFEIYRFDTMHVPCISIINFNTNKKIQILLPARAPLINQNYFPRFTPFSVSMRTDATV